MNEQREEDLPPIELEPPPPRWWSKFYPKGARIMNYGSEAPPGWKVVSVVRHRMIIEKE